MTRQTSFSPQTCVELIDTLSDVQLQRELQYIGAKHSGPVTRQQKPLQVRELRDYYKQSLELVDPQQSLQVQELISTFSRNIRDAEAQNKEMPELLAGAQKLLATERERRTAAALSPRRLPSRPDSYGNADQDTTGTVLSTTDIEPPYFKHLKFALTNFDCDTLDKATDYTRNFSSRKVGYYGDQPYKYTGGYHRARPLTDNTYLSEIAEAVKVLYPDFNYNSALVTKYESHKACLPPHSDNEPAIDSDSTIVTVSLGATRELHYRRKLSRDRTVLLAENGDVFAMTRSSQNIYDHAVPETDPANDGVRISVTFRLLTPTVRTDRTRTPASLGGTDRRTNSPKRVLILSDSKNATFDCGLLKEPVVCFREDCFFLRDLDKHCDLIGKADVVLISAGINDMVKNAAGPRLLHDHISNFTREMHVKYPRVRFLFDAIAPLPMTADRYNIMNPAINQLNRMMFELSLRAPNIKLFDNVGFGMSHLAKDGIHLNDFGKRAATKNWVHVILIATFLRAGHLPLRPDFQDAATRYYSKVG